jgi:hypothetical protein
VKLSCIEKYTVATIERYHSFDESKSCTSVFEPDLSGTCNCCLVMKQCKINFYRNLFKQLFTFTGRSDNSSAPPWRTGTTTNMKSQQNLPQ